MDNRRKELETQIFDPTGQGVEVVDADYARTLLRDLEDAEGRGRQLQETFDAILVSLHGESCEAEKVGGVADCVKRIIGERNDALASLESLPESPTERDGEGGRQVRGILLDEIERIRAIFPKILEAVGNRTACGVGASVEFLESIPSKVRDAFSSSKDNLPNREEESPRSESLMARDLHEISEEVGDFLDHPDCTIPDAVRLMKCRLKELEVAEARYNIYRTWRD
jgi:hypothetical protein